MNWHDKTEVKKGDIGEEIVKNILEKKGYIVYKPITNGAHKIDYFVHSGSEKKIMCCEVKTKRRMARYARTGCDISSHEQYLEIYKKHNIDTFIFFVDDFEECIYGQWLSVLGEGIIINRYSKVIVWELSTMKKIIELTNDQVSEINKFTKEVYDYSNVVKYFEPKQQQQ